MHISLLIASYAFCRSRNTSYNTSSLIFIHCWSNLASTEAVPVPRPAHYPWSTLWNCTPPPIRWFIAPENAFHMTSTRPIPLNSPIPLEIITTVFHVQSSGILPSLNVVWGISTNRSQLVVSRRYSWVAAASKYCKFSTRMPDGSPERWRQRGHTSQSISYIKGMDSYIVKGDILIGMMSAGAGTWR